MEIKHYDIIEFAENYTSKIVDGKSKPTVLYEWQKEFLKRGNKND